MITPTIFDYQQLDAETRIVVQQEDKEFERNMGEANTSFVHACKNLQRIHEALKYKRPGFVDWCNSKPGLSRATAQKMLNVAEMLLDSGNIPIESREALYLLASPSTPEPARQEAIERAQTGEKVAYSDTQEILARHSGRCSHSWEMIGCSYGLHGIVLQCEKCQQYGLVEKHSSDEWQQAYYANPDNPVPWSKKKYNRAIEQGEDFLERVKAAEVRLAQIMKKNREAEAWRQLAPDPTPAREDIPAPRPYAPQHTTAATFEHSIPAPTVTFTQPLPPPPPRRDVLERLRGLWWTATPEERQEFLEWVSNNN